MAMSKAQTKQQKNELIWGWIFFLPTLLGLLVLNIIPMIYTVFQSFYQTGAFGKGNVFVGIKNYSRLIADKNVWQAVLNTFAYAIVEVPLSIIIALILAVMLNKKIKGRTIYRAIYFLPMVVAPAAIAMVWRWLYNSEFGLFNYCLKAIGLPKVNWITNQNIAIFFIALVGVWSIIGYNLVLFLAGIQEIPKDYYEAASLDGASEVNKFINITIPLISPTMFFVIVTRIIGALQVFDIIYMMVDRANPALNRTQSLVYLFYKYSFMENNKGYGSAIVVLLLVIITIITILQNKAQKKWVIYN